jgi:hypothetical protein
MGIGRSVSSLLSALCRSFAGEHLLVTDHRGAGESEGYRHWPLWHCPASDVYGNHSPVPGDAAGTCFALFFPYNAALHPSQRILRSEKNDLGKPQFCVAQEYSLYLLQL